MRKKPPRRASLDEVKITREGEMAVIEHADPNVSVARVNIGSQLQGLFRFSRPISGSYFWCPPISNGCLDLSAMGI